jgi:hypothetical protein
MDQNVKLNDLMFKALDHAIDSIASGGELVTFVMTENNLQRFVTSTLDESKERAEEYLIGLKGETLAALAYEGYLTLEGTKFNAVFTKAFDVNEEKGVLIAQRYEPKGFLKKFNIVGNPALIEHPSNPWK